jgi:hypothetical protein
VGYADVDRLRIARHEEGDGPAVESKAGARAFPLVAVRQLRH